ncbi:winged helix-turn-helix domain-containing protein [Tabrizicola caldifontis]|uniref:winged helix-turn-helix domain-containing protein n=2 Tax=Tabrizicola TaxID=1443919 RepID=UPI003211EAD0
MAILATHSCRRPTATCETGKRLLLHATVTGPDSRDMDTNTKRPVLRIRIVFGDEEMIGPGKAELLERIDRCGSIAAAGREMSMSYKRAWQLIGTLNAMFREPLVDSTRGGPGGGGAVLTETGRRVLALYRAFEADAAAAGAARLNDMQALLRDIPDGR